MSVAAPGEVHVLAGVIFDEAGRVLLAQRPSSKDLAGYWEFPGGKLEPGESRFDALSRELREELGIQIAPARPLTRVRHAYPHKRVLLDFWIVRQFTGRPQGLDGQALQWCSAADLAAVPLLPADRPMLRLVSLPATLHAPKGPGFEVLSSVREATREQTVGILCRGPADAVRAVAEGADFVVLSQALIAAEVAALCTAIATPVFAHGLTLQEAWNLGATGISTLGANADCVTLQSPVSAGRGREWLTCDARTGPGAT